MQETYTIHVTDNGYVIRNQSDVYNGGVGDMRIAANGQLEAELNVFRVSGRLNNTIDDNAKPHATPAPITYSPIEQENKRLQAENNAMRDMLARIATPQATIHPEIAHAMEESLKAGDLRNWKSI